MQSEIAQIEGAKFYVYLHVRPSGEIFYVGKGSNRRAFDMSPTRRTAHHRNIVNKYGRDAIEVRMIPCMYEEEAFQLEKALIAIHKPTLVNLTDGGEGRAGRPATPAQQAALAKGRSKLKTISVESKERILDGLARGRAKLDAYRASDAGKSHLERLAQIGKETLHRQRSLVCVQCEQSFVTRSAKAKCCSRLCEQRHRRAQQCSAK